jgi:hypothetical protein
METLGGLGGLLPYLPYVVGIGAMAVIGAISVGALIPLDSVPAVTGVTIITAVAYAASILIWIMVLLFVSRRENADHHLTLLNTHMLWLVVFPVTIAATAMNVTSVQNTRNLLAGRVAA